MNKKRIAHDERECMIAEMRKDAGGVEVKLGDRVGVSVTRGKSIFFQSPEPLTRERALQLAAIFAFATMEDGS